MAIISNLFRQTLESYKLAFIFIGLALPLVMVPVFFEALQHFVEFHLGMFALEKGDVFSNQKHAIRIAFGMIKVISLMFIFLVLPRFFLKDYTRNNIVSFTRQNASALLKGLIAVLVMMLWVFLIGPVILAFLMPSLSALKATLLLLFSPFLVMFIFSKAVNNWMAGLWGLPLPAADQHKAINNAIYGIGFIVQIAAIFPAMALHYWLGFNAMGATGTTLAILLILDSLVVGLLACLMASCVFVLFRDTYEPVYRNNFKSTLS